MNKGEPVKALLDRIWSNAVDRHVSDDAEYNAVDLGVAMAAAAREAIDEAFNLGRPADGYWARLYDAHQRLDTALGALRGGGPANTASLEEAVERVVAELDEPQSRTVKRCWAVALALGEDSMDSLTTQRLFTRTEALVQRCSAAEDEVVDLRELSTELRADLRATEAARKTAQRRGWVSATAAAAMWAARNARDGEWIARMLFAGAHEEDKVELGIVVTVSEANHVYAKELGRPVESLTDDEKTAALRQLALAKIREIAAARPAREVLGLPSKE